MAILTIEASASGTIQGTSNTYSTARSTSTGSDDAAANFSLGQAGRIGTPNYYVFRGFVLFPIPAWLSQATIYSAALRLAASSDASTAQDFNVQIKRATVAFPLATSRESKYDAALAAALDEVWRSTAGMSLNTVYDSPATLDISRIVPGGDVSFALMSSRDASASAPSTADTNEYINLHSHLASNAALRPQLLISYQLPGGVIAML